METGHCVCPEVVSIFPPLVLVKKHYKRQRSFSRQVCCHCRRIRSLIFLGKTSRIFVSSFSSSIVICVKILLKKQQQQQQQQKCSRVWAIFFKKRKSVLPSSARDTTPKNREKKADSKHEVPTPIKIRNYVWLACETRAKIALSEPDTSLTTTLLLSLRRPR